MLCVCPFTISELIYNTDLTQLGPQQYCHVPRSHRDRNCSVATRNKVRHVLCEYRQAGRRSNPQREKLEDSTQIVFFDELKMGPVRSIRDSRTIYSECVMIGHHAITVSIPGGLTGQISYGKLATLPTSVFRFYLSHIPPICIIIPLKEKEKYCYNVKNKKPHPLSKLLYCCGWNYCFLL